MKKYTPLLLIVFTIIMIVVRSPVLFVTPRFWAEEGQQYFAYAYNHSFLQNIFIQFYGYYTLIPNLATGLATCIPLEYAPLFTTCVAIIIKVIICGVIIFGKASYWDNTFKKLFVITTLLILSPAETWAQTIHSMFWLSLGTLFILLERMEDTKLSVKYFYRIILLISGLTGVTSCFMMPIFYLKAYRTKLKEDYLNAYILILCLILQLYCFLTAIVSHNGTLSGRFNTKEFDILANLLRFFVWPFVGEVWNFSFNYNTNIILNIAVLVAFLIYYLIVIYQNYKIYNVQYLAATFTIVVILSVALSIKSIPLPQGDRYTLIPSYCLFMLMYHSALNNLQNIFIRFISIILIVVISVHTMNIYRSRMMSFADPTWPIWSDEVKLWRANPFYELRIWPAWGGAHWVVKLQKKDF